MVSGCSSSGSGVAATDSPLVSYTHAIEIAYTGHALPGPEARARTRQLLWRMLGGLTVLTGAGVALGDGLHRVVTHFGIPQSLLGNAAIAAAAISLSS